MSADGALVDDPVSRPIDEDPFLVGLRNATQPHEGRQRVVERLKQLRDTTPEGSTREVLVRWMHYLVEQARNKGKPLELATVHGYRAAIATRLVGILPEYLSDVSAEDLGDLLDEVVESATSPTLRHRLCELIRRFNAFRIREGIAVDGRIELPTRDGGECDVSARYITEQQYESALLHLHEGKDSTAALEARVFLILAYRFGLRRSEILGLTLGDVRRGDPDHDLVVRPNALRDLKTSNAVRRLPLALLSDTERREVHALRDVRCDAAKGPGSPNLSRHQYVFFHELTPAKWLLAAHPAPRTVLAALRFATGDEGLHVHHLRHSFATRLALGALISSCTKSAQQGLPNFMRAMPSQAKMFHALCRARRDPMARRFTTVSVAMGHGSDATTFQHYVHGLDAVLHAVMRAALPKPRKPKQGDAQPVDPAAAEARLICILLHRSADTRPPEGRLHAWLLGHCRRNGVAVEDLAPPTSPSGRTHALELDWALRQSAVRDLPGRPDSLATRRVVEAVLSALRAGFMRNPIATSQALEYLAREPVEAGWVVLTAAEVSGLQMAFRAACPGDLKLEYRLAARGKRRLATRSLAKALSTGACMEVRLRDPAADASTQRQRSWPAIAWAVRTAQVWASDHDL